MRIGPSQIMLGLFAGTLVCFGAAAAAEELPERAMYGFNRETGEMYRYQFEGQWFESFGVLRDEDGRAMVGIDAAAYAYAFSHIYAFWYDGEAGVSKLVHVHPETGESFVNKNTLEGGPITGAVAIEAGANKDRVFATQTTEGVLDVFGDANINPNASGGMGFVLELAEEVEGYGDSLDRWNLQQWGKNDIRQPFSQIESFGGKGWVLAERIQIRPKGSARRESFMHLAETEIELATRQNGNIFDLEARGEPMRVSLWNTAKNGAAMGKWYIRIEATPSDGGAYTGPSRLIEIDPHQEGAVTLIADLSRTYDGLASMDGELFLASSGHAMYLIDARDDRNVREHRLSDMNASAVRGLEFTDVALMGFDAQADRLRRFNTQSGAAIGPAMDVRMRQCGTIVFSPKVFEYEAYD